MEQFWLILGAAYTAYAYWGFIQGTYSLACYVADNKEPEGKFRYLTALRFVGVAAIFVSTWLPPLKPNMSIEMLVIFGCSLFFPPAILGARKGFQRAKNRMSQSPLL